MLEGLKRAFGFKRPERDLNEKEFSFAKKLFPNQTKQNYHTLVLSLSLSLYIYIYIYTHIHIYIFIIYMYICVCVLVI